ncbi:MAG: hypothetical protein M3Q75_08555 [Gemmatimonadota bacterium]|nr:hypothetical protein [Gemmatimonadota bacterium]
MITFSLYLALLWQLGAAVPETRPDEDSHPSVLLLTRAARDSMSSVFRHFNQHWDELADLTTLEQMLGTIRPTQLEYLGCLQGSVQGDTVRIESWQPAADLKQLQFAVDGNCDTVPRLLGTWHTHPYRADLQNRAIKERSLSAQDLDTFAGAPFSVMLVMWDIDSVDAALRSGSGSLIHPAAVTVGPPLPRGYIVPDD